MKHAIGPPHREPSGRRKRPSQKEIAAAQADALKRAVRHVLDQPHRAGDNDQRLHCTLGQACKALKLREELYRAGEEYAGLVRRWRVAIAGIRPEGHKASGLPQEEITRELADRLTSKVTEADNVLKAVKAYPYVRHVCVDCPTEEWRSIASEFGPKLRNGLFELALHFGMLKPFDRT